MRVHTIMEEFAESGELEFSSLLCLNVRSLLGSMSRTVLSLQTRTKLFG